MWNAIEINNLTKTFGEIVALEGISFTVREREIYGLIGPNGAGKTTTLRILSTLIKPSSGSATIFGNEVVKSAEKVRGIISYLPEEAGAYQNLSGYEYLSFMAGFYADGKESADEMLQEAELVSGLSERLDDRIKGYSRGMKRRLLLSRALMVKPKLLILDEPTSGLDVVHAFHVRQVIKEYAANKGVTILLSSHNMLEVEYLCHSVALINEGKIIAEGSPDELNQKFSADNLEQVFMEIAKLG
ncbi:multidrug ABC transporter ATP-binding protein [Candidatus Bathyarchaeota archaeon]|jgi:ABC-2 type transport system ATP-binding protein|nr:multidrug ABC transporter ATP-binding protein [Candidatus Bathyarchaeota archaeon]MDP6049269.1 ABC transporter ATP-binding protein [Candidatus Bathyarchaeota archaeon]|tara:strand:+ start:452 stop:1183 length:732 start_codon:yes stop_codon:yes gene_type:complete